MIATLILAAGASSRMGARDKLLENVDGVPLLARQTARALEVGPTFVVLPDANHPRAGILPNAAQTVIAAKAHLGIGHSIAAGITALPETCTGVIILPADLPDITTSDITLIAEHAGRAPIVRASTQSGKPGHPTYFGASLFKDLTELRGDRGAAELCRKYANDTQFVPLQGDRARLDLDTPADWAAYRARLKT